MPTRHSIPRDWSASFCFPSGYPSADFNHAAAVFLIPAVSDSFGCGVWPEDGGSGVWLDPESRAFGLGPLDFGRGHLEGLGYCCFWKERERNGNGRAGCPGLYTQRTTQRGGLTISIPHTPSTYLAVPPTFPFLVSLYTLVRFASFRFVIDSSRFWVIYALPPPFPSLVSRLNTNHDAYDLSQETRERSVHILFPALFFFDFVFFFAKYAGLLSMSSKMVHRRDSTSEGSKKDAVMNVVSVLCRRCLVRCSTGKEDEHVVVIMFVVLVSHLCFLRVLSVVPCDRSELLII